MKNKLATLVGALALSAAASAQTWIWYPGDYEIWLGNRMNNRRTERGAFFPPFWKTDSHYVVVEFSKKLYFPSAAMKISSGSARSNFLLNSTTT